MILFWSLSHPPTNRPETTKTERGRKKKGKKKGEHRFVRGFWLNREGEKNLQTPEMVRRKEGKKEKSSVPRRKS